MERLIGFTTIQRGIFMQSIRERLTGYRQRSRPRPPTRSLGFPSIRHKAAYILPLLCCLIVTACTPAAEVDVRAELAYFYGDSLYVEDGHYYAVNYTIREADGQLPVREDGTPKYRVYLETPDTVSLEVHTENPERVVVTLSYSGESGRLEFGERYRLEKLIGEQWYEINSLTGFTDIGYWLDPGGSHSYTIDLRGQGVTALSPGNYRLTHLHLCILDDPSDLKFAPFDITTEFVIEGE